MDESIWRRDLRDLARRLSKGETLIVKMKKSCYPEVKNHLQLIGVLDPAYRDSFCDYLPGIDKFALITDFVDAMIANTLSLERKLKSYRSKKKDDNYIYLNGGIVDKNTMQFVEALQAGIPNKVFMECLKPDQEVEKKCTCKKCKKKKENDPVKEKVNHLISKTPKNNLTLKRPPEYKKEKPLVIDLPKSLKKFENTIIEDIKGYLKFSNNEIVELINDHLNHDKYSLRRFIIPGQPSYCIICEKDKSTKRFVPETRIEVR
jgi:hypothetical protein